MKHKVFTLPLLPPKQTHDFISQLSKKVQDIMANTGEQCVTIPAPSNLSVDLFRELIAHGFLPSSKNLHVNEAPESKMLWEHIYFNSYNDQTIKFWTGRSSTEIVKEIREFEYCTLEKLRSESIKTADSFGLLLFSPQNIYVESRRPVTDMAMFRFPNSIAYTTRPKDEYGNNSGFLPVTRYAFGMKKSLFFEDLPSEENNHCGTFYYYEPESPTFLYFENAFMARNKSEAFLTLWHKSDKRTQKKYIKQFQIEVRDKFNVALDDKLSLTDVDVRKIVRDIEDMDKLMELSFSRYLTLNPMLTPLNFAKILQESNEESEEEESEEEEIMEDWEQEEYLETAVVNENSNFKYEPPIDQVDQLPDKPFWAAFTLRLYGQEDALDQPLCELARQQGYDVVILDRMIGSRQFVVEVLDVRSRDESFKNLHFPEN